jgi:hypothetical protein
MCGAKNSASMTRKHPGDQRQPKRLQPTFVVVDRVPAGI